MKWILRNALVSLLGIVAILGMVAAGIVVSGPEGEPDVLPSSTPFPSGWKFVEKGWSSSSPPPPVYVTENLPSAWPVSTAKSLVDSYTTGKISLVSKCPASALRCVNIRSGSVSGSPIAYTSCKSWKCSITVDVKDATRTGQFGPITRKWLLVHELGHVFGLGHRKSCATAMYPNRRCSGHTPPLKFDTSQRTVLKRG